MSSDVYTALAERVGGLDALYLAYYRAQQEMLEVLQPEVVGHFDLIRKFAPLTFQAGAAVDEAGRANLEFIADYGGVLDVNARALQRWTEPYPAREWLTQALQLGIEVTLGDDSHSPEDVGVGLDRCRDILLEIGYRYVARLEADGSRQQVPLE